LTGVAGNTIYKTSRAYTINGLNANAGLLKTAHKDYSLRDGTPIVAATSANVFSYTPGTGPDALKKYNGYVATASGIISPVFARNSGTATEYDWWTIDHERTLRNVQDGVRQ
jgi:hypothetical protein